MSNQIILLVVMFALMYFLLIRPNQKRQKAIREMQSSLKIGDEIITIGGLHGKITALEDKSFVLKAEGGSELRFDRQAIRDVIKQG